MSDSGFWGSGWSFPPTFEVGNYQLELTHKESNINQSIDIILSTLHGERVMAPTFGSRLRSYLFKNMDETTQGEIIYSVKNTLLDYEPRITVDEVGIRVLEGAEPVVELTIIYTIRKTNSRHNHVFPFSINEGTNLQMNSISNRSGN